jgi:hypothetical protein
MISTGAGAYHSESNDRQFNSNNRRSQRATKQCPLCWTIEKILRSPPSLRRRLGPII